MAGVGPPPLGCGGQAKGSTRRPRSCVLPGRGLTEMGFWHPSGGYQRIAGELGKLGFSVTLALGSARATPVAEKLVRFGPERGVRSR
jgi:hypothetical protein